MATVEMTPPPSPYSTSTDDFETQWRMSHAGCVRPANDSWAAALALAEGRAALATALGLRRGDSSARRDGIGVMDGEWAGAFNALALTPHLMHDSLRLRFNAVDVWLAPTALSLASLQVEVEEDTTLGTAAHWAMELYYSKDLTAEAEESIVKLSDCPRALTGFVTEWLVELKANMAIAQVLKGSTGKFSPETVLIPFATAHGGCCMPPEYVELLERNDGNDNLWVLKHDGTSGGDGVTVVNSVASVEAAMSRCARQLTSDSQILGSQGSQETFHFVLQRYISAPMLIDGYKFGLRAYTMSHRGKTFLYSEYFVKLGGTPYDAANITDRRAHLTHHGVTHTHLRACTATEIAHRLQMPKCSQTDAGAQLEALHCEVRRKLAAAVACSELSERSNHESATAEFVLLGWDIVIDQQGEAWICEGQRGVGCVSRQDHECFSQRYLVSEYSLPRQALLTALGSSGSEYANKLSGNDNSDDMIGSRTDLEGRLLPEFEELCLEECDEAQSSLMPHSSPDIDALLQPTVRAQVLQCLVRMGLLVSETTAVFDSFRWPDPWPRGSARGQPLRRLLRTARDTKGRTVVHTASAAGFLDLLTVLIEETTAAGGDVSHMLQQKDANGRTPLHAAAEGGSESTMELLLANGADVNALDNSATSALMLAAAEAPVRCLEMLLAHGATCEAASARTGTALHWAVAAGRLAAARLLADASPKQLVHSRDASGHSAIVLAAANGSAEILRLLIEQGADINEKINVDGESCGSAVLGSGATILHILADGGDEPSFSALLNASDPAALQKLGMAETDDGMNAVSIAAFAGHATLAARILAAIPGIDAQMDEMERCRVASLIAGATMSFNSETNSIYDLTPELTLCACAAANAGDYAAAVTSLRRVLCDQYADLSASGESRSVLRCGKWWHQLAAWELALGEPLPAVRNAEVAARNLQWEMGWASTSQAECPAAARAQLLRAEALIAASQFDDAGQACWDAMELDDSAEVLIEARSLIKLASFEGREDLLLFDSDSAEFMATLELGSYN